VKSALSFTLVASIVMASPPVGAQEVTPISLNTLETGTGLKIDRSVSMLPGLPMSVAAPPTAQTAASSFADLQGRLKADQTVYVQTAEVADPPRRAIKGKVLELSASTLRLLVDGQRREFAEPDVGVISDRYHHSARKGAGIGALIGLAVGVALGLRNVAQWCSRPGDSCGTARAVLVFGSGAFAAVGAEVGALTAADIVHERVLFLAPDLRQQPAR
jgi:hypothetical protein